MPLIPKLRNCILQFSDALDLCFCQFNLKLPTEVDEYYAVKEKCKAAGWIPGKVRSRGRFTSGWIRFAKKVLELSLNLWFSK
jgi:hypothetical protein